MSLRIPGSAAPVQAVHTRWPQADRKDEVRVVRRTTVWIDLLVHHVPRAGLCERWRLRVSWLYDGQKALLWRGLDRLISRHRGGRPEQWTPGQNKRLVALSEAGPGGGGETAWGHSVLIRVLIWRAFGVLAKRHDVCPLLHTLGCSFPQARWVSAHLAAAKRLAWRQDKWPAMVGAAKRCTGLILWEDEASVAPWGARSDPWARRGPQPEVPTSGTRQGDTVWGAMASFAGRLCSRGLEGHLNSASSQGFVQMSMAQTAAHRCLIPDGARDHTSAATQAFVAAHSDRITAHPLPSYAPDDHPIASLGQKTKQRATHHKDFKECTALTVSVDKALA